MRTRLICTVTALAAAAAPLSAVGAPARAAAPVVAPVTAPAADATPGYSRRPITVTVKVGPERDQTCRVTADLYKPDGVNRRHRAPAILTTNGFGGSKRGAGEVGTALGFVQEGYVVLAYSGLGFGGSGCKIYLDDPDYDGRAGAQMVGVLAGTRSFTNSAGARKRLDYVARDGRRDPRVGMIGGSYGGQVQFAVAMQDRRVDAIVPEITWHDLPYSLSPNNTSFTSGVRNGEPGVHKKVWSTAFFSLGVQQGLENIQSDPARAEGCPNFRDEVCPAKAQLDTLGYLDGDNRALASHASVGSYLDRIHVPTLLVQGQKDTLFNLQEATATYRGLRARGVPTRMIWRSFGHSDSTPAAGEYADPRIGHRLTETYLGRRYLAWMDRYVRGRKATDVGPRFSYFRDWVSYDAKRAGRDVTRGLRPRVVAAGPQRAPLPVRRRRAGPRRRRRGGRQRVLRQRRPGPHVVLRDLRGRRPGRPAGGRPGHVRQLDEPGADGARRPGRRAPPHGAGGLPHRRGHPVVGHGRQADPLRQAVRRGARRHPDPQGPPGLPGPGGRRDPAAERRAARRRAPLRDRPPAAPGRRGERLRLREQHRTAAGHGAHQHRRPGDAEPAHDRWRCGSDRFVRFMWSPPRNSSDPQRGAHVFVHNGHRRDFEA